MGRCSKTLLVFKDLLPPSTEIESKIKNRFVVFQKNSKMTSSLKCKRLHDKLVRLVILLGLTLIFVLLCCIDLTSPPTNSSSILLPAEWEEIDHVERDSDTHDTQRFLRWIKDGSPPIVLPVRQEVPLPTTSPNPNATPRTPLRRPLDSVSPKKQLTAEEHEEAELKRSFNLVKRKGCAAMRFDEKAQKLRVHFFVIHHGGASRYIAKAFQYCREEWVTLVQLPKTPFFESGLTLSHFSDERLAKMERDYDYFFITGYKVVAHEAETIFRYATEEMLEHMALYARATAASCDVFPFHDDATIPSFLEDSVRIYHPNSTWDATTAVLSDMQFSEEQISKANDMRIFIRNTYMIKSTAMRVFARSARSSINRMRRNEHTLRLLETDSLYEGPSRVAMQMFNQSFYMQHPFVFERMTAVFMTAKDMKVCYRFSGHYA